MSTPIRYSFGADEHLFAEVSDSMSLDAFFKGLAVTRAVERLALDGVLDICLANASFQIRFDPDRIAPHTLLEAVKIAEAGVVAERTLQTRIIEIPVLYNDPWTHETLMRFRDRHQDPSATDLEYTARINGLADVDAIIAAHSGAPWFVSMVGFVAGLPFMFQMVERERQFAGAQVPAPAYRHTETDPGSRRLLWLHLLGARRRRLSDVWRHPRADLRPATEPRVPERTHGVFPSGRHRAIQTDGSRGLRPRRGRSGSGAL